MNKLDLFKDANLISEADQKKIIAGEGSYHHDNGDSYHHDNGDSLHDDNGDSLHHDTNGESLHDDLTFPGYEPKN